MTRHLRIYDHFAIPHLSNTSTAWGPGTKLVPGGGGRAWPGFEIDYSEPQARVWRSRGRAAAPGHLDNR